jgi:hypothetical protein
MRPRSNSPLLAPDPNEGGTPLPEAGKTDPVPSPAATVKGRKTPDQIGLEKKVSQLEDQLASFRKESNERWTVFDGFMQQPSPRPPTPGQPRKTFGDELCDFLGVTD